MGLIHREALFLLVPRTQKVVKLRIFFIGKRRIGR
jgi:hypothetical protein